MSQKQHDAVLYLMSELLGEHGELHHGDCEGADIEAAKIANWYHYRIVCHPPISPARRGFFQYNTEIREACDYKIRDQHIVDESDVLIAAPHGTEVARSGT
jgi:hypothetical protein